MIKSIPEVILASSMGNNGPAESKTNDGKSKTANLFHQRTPSSKSAEEEIESPSKNVPSPNGNNLHADSDT